MSSAIGGQLTELVIVELAAALDRRFERGLPEVATQPAIQRRLAVRIGTERRRGVAHRHPAVEDGRRLGVAERREHLHHAAHDRHADRPE